MDLPPPSGRQHVLVHGDQQAVVVEVGGGLRSYRVGDRELLDGYAESDTATAARGQLLIPWPNRVRDGRYTWDGQEHQLALNEPEKSNAIHGLLRWVSWATAAQTTRSVEMRCRLHPAPGYPFLLDVTVAYRLGDDGLEVTTTARNAGRSALPYAAGQHPYLLTAARVDDCTLELDAATFVETDERGLPVRRSDVAGSSFDFRSPRLIGDLELDHAFTDLARGSDGRAVLRLATAGEAHTVLWVDESYRYIEVFTGDTVPDPSRRRRALGVEPMTAPPNALGDGVDVRRLEPGESTTSRWGMTLQSGA